ncbi:MAG: putative TonB-dependent receptor BfrD [Stenotrophomonas maltophilia]|nr:MAG: putative TonB-dependent receptor BfrD [Stenotrophomonas maltophilia]
MSAANTLNLSRTPPSTLRNTLAPLVGLSTFMALPLATWAADAAPEAQAEPQATSSVTKLPDMTVQAEQEAAYKVDHASSPKMTEKLLDTPQSVTVISKQLLKEQNAQSLKDALRNVPGITFNSGEGGGGVGDSLTIRGFNADANIYRDGVRDAAKYSRDDFFNTEAVEVFKGSSSSGWGVGAVGGAVNLVTKTPELDDFNHLNAGVGTANYKRATLDVNHTLDGLGEGAAFRVNVMGANTGVDGRDWIGDERYGFAPSLALGLGTDTRFIVAYEYLHDDATPDYGIPTVNGHYGSKPSRAGGAGYSSYWGWRNLDYENNESHRLNLKFAHDFSDALSLNTQFTYFHLDHDFFVTTPGGDANAGAPGIQAGKGIYRRNINTPLRSQTNDTYSNQTDLTWRFDTFGIRHTLVGGFDINKQSLDSRTGALTAASRTQMGNLPVASNDWSKYPYAVDTYTSAKQSVEQTDKAFYLLDTLKFDEHWELHLAARQDHFDTRVLSSKTRASETAAWVDKGNSSQNEKLTSVHTALTYKPVENGSFYISYANAKQPSGVLAVAQTGSIASTKGDRGKTYEAGTKWELFDGALALNGDVFQTKRQLTYIDDEELSAYTGGEERVRGIELSGTGNITRDWSIYAAFVHQNSKLIKPYNGSEEGLQLANTPQNAFNLWSTWQLPHDLALSYGVRYVDEVKIYPGLGSTITRAGQTTVPDYVVHDAMLSWQATQDVQVHLNVNNLFDKHYWSQYNGRGYGVPGAGRGAVLSADYSF